MKQFIFVFCIICIATSIGYTQTSLPENTTTSSDSLVLAPDEFASYPGGEIAIGKYLSRAIQYPRKAETMGLSGKVIVYFEVDVNGTVVNVRVTKSSDPIFNEEAIRVVKNMPTWTPAKLNGKPVKTRMLQPIVFHYQE